MPAQLALVAYLIACALAIGYACVRGLTITRRITVCVLALVLEFNAGLLMVSRYADLAYAVGIPCMLALGLVMTAPRQSRSGAVPATTSTAAGSTAWQIGRRAPVHVAPAPSLADPRAVLTASTARHVAYSAAPAKATATSTRNRGRRAGDRGLAGRRVAARERRRGRQASASFTRAWRCRSR